MLALVPTEELAAMGTRMLDGTEAVGEVQSVLQGSELRLRVRIVIGGVRPRVRLRQAEVDHEKCHSRRSSAPSSPGFAQVYDAYA